MAFFEAHQVAIGIRTQLAKSARVMEQKLLNVNTETRVTTQSLVLKKSYDCSSAIDRVSIIKNSHCGIVESWVEKDQKGLSEDGIFKDFSL